MNSHEGSTESVRRKRWLCVAYAFPPINRSGTHRTLGFVKHLDRMGWKATVLTVRPRDELLDESLSDEVPASTTVLRTAWVDCVGVVKRSLLPRTGAGASPGAVGSGRCDTTFAVSKAGRPGFRDWCGRLLQTPDSRIGWIGPAVRAAMREIRLRRPAVLYSTSPYMSAHLIALILSRRTGLPWVADFRDPWTLNPFRELPYASLRRWDEWLERRVLARASHIVCCTPTMTQGLCRRTAGIRNKCSTILNGFDAQRLHGLKPKRDAPDDHFVLTHCGQFYGGRSPRVWFEALRRALRRTPEIAQKLHVVLIGPTTFDGGSLCDLANSYGLADVVDVLGPRSHAEALAYMAGSDALILAASGGTGGELQVPNKLYEYIAMRKPIIATCSRGNPVIDILNEARAEAFVCEPDEAEVLADELTRLVRQRCIEVPSPWSGVERFERSHRAAELAAVFDRVVRVVGASNRSSAVPASVRIVDRSDRLPLGNIRPYPA